MAISLMNEKFLEAVAEFIKGEKDRLIYNGEIFQILEGNLKPILEKRMMDDLGPDSVKAAKTRTAPINVLERVVDKQTSIYTDRVIRTVEGPKVTESDKALLKWYEDTLNINFKLNENNAFYNAFQYALLQIALKEDQGGKSKPFIRSIPNHQFLIMNDPRSIDPTTPDLIIVMMGSYKDASGERQRFALYTNDEYMLINDLGKILADEMQAREQDGNNPYGVTPFTYANASQNLAMPMIQTDSLDMAVLIPLLLTDLNYAVKFQSFGMFVAIDIEDGAIKVSPNSILKLKSDGKGEKPDFKTIKPEVDIADVLNLAASEMGLWLTTKGIRPGAIGQLGADQFASGVSKMIDESDTYESKKKQIAQYTAFEQDFWDRLFRHIHPFWVTLGLIENKAMLSVGAFVKTEFEKPVPMQTRGEKVKDLDAEVVAGFTSRRRAVKALNPDSSEAAIDELIAEIDSERRIVLPAEEQTEGGTDDQE